MLVRLLYASRAADAFDAAALSRILEQSKRMFVQILSMKFLHS